MWLPSTQDRILIYKARLAFPGPRSNVRGEALLLTDFGNLGYGPYENRRGNGSFGGIGGMRTTCAES